MRITLFSFFFFAILSGTAWADHVTDGIEAASRGDYAKAEQLFRQSPENAPAEYGLGVLYEKGLGVEKDPRQAAEYYEKAARRDFAPAAVNLGVLYAEGRGVAQSYEKAAFWYEKAAEKGNVLAWRNLAVMAAKGLGAPQNMEEAYKWAELAGSKGDAPSLHLREFIAKAMRKEQIAAAKEAARSYKIREDYVR